MKSPIVTTDIASWLNKHSSDLYPQKPESNPPSRPKNATELSPGAFKNIFSGFPEESSDDQARAWVHENIVAQDDEVVARALIGAVRADQKGIFEAMINNVSTIKYDDTHLKYVDPYEERKKVEGIPYSGLRGRLVYEAIYHKSPGLLGRFLRKRRFIIKNRESLDLFKTIFDLIGEALSDKEGYRVTLKLGTSPRDRRLAEQAFWKYRQSPKFLRVLYRLGAPLPVNPARIITYSDEKVPEEINPGSNSFRERHRVISSPETLCIPNFPDLLPNCVEEVGSIEREYAWEIIAKSSRTRFERIKRLVRKRTDHDVPSRIPLKLISANAGGLVIRPPLRSKDSTTRQIRLEEFQKVSPREQSLHLELSDQVLKWSYRHRLEGLNGSFVEGIICYEARWLSAALTFLHHLKKG